MSTSKVVSQYPLAKGALYSINTVLDAKYSNFQTHPFFVTFMLKVALSSNNVEEPLADTCRVGSTSPYKSPIDLRIAYFSNFIAPSHGDSFAFVNSNGQVCVGIKCGNACKLLGVKIGQEVRLLLK